MNRPPSLSLTLPAPRRVATALALLLAAAGAAAADLRGRYLTASGNLEVEVQPCGDALCGVVRKVIADHSMSRPGQPMQAVDPRPALGLQILHDVRAHGDEQPPVQWQGRIYNRENGKTYDCRLSLDAAGHLVVRPYIGLPLFGQTQVWQRLSAAAILPPSA